MKKIINLILLTGSLVILFSGCIKGRINQPEITAQELSQHVYFLASDSLKGRYPGTPECNVAANYIRNHFKESGLKLLGNNGFEPFSVSIKVKEGKNNSMEIGKTIIALDCGFAPMSFTGNDSLMADVVFAGYGFDINEDSLKWNDYAGMDVSGTGTSPISDSLIKATPGADFCNLALELANMERKLIFQQAGPKEESGYSRRGFKVILGFMPDYAGNEKHGLRVDMVITGRPAALGGMKKGDIITATNGQPVRNIYDYMYRLAKLHPGQTITVEVLRNSKKKVLLIQL